MPTIWGYKYPLFFFVIFLLNCTYSVCWFELYSCTVLQLYTCSGKAGNVRCWRCVRQNRHPRRRHPGWRQDNGVGSQGEFYILNLQVKQKEILPIDCFQSTRTAVVNSSINVKIYIKSSSCLKCISIIDLIPRSLPIHISHKLLGFVTPSALDYLVNMFLSLRMLLNGTGQLNNINKD